MRFFAVKSWSPYIVGLSIGVLSWFAFATANKPIGITTAFEYTAGLTEKATYHRSLNHTWRPRKRTAKLRKSIGSGCWLLAFSLGAWLSARISDDPTERSVPPLWEWRFGPSVPNGSQRRSSAAH